MGEISTTVKLVIAAGAGAALLAYVSIAEVGVNAGRIHYGVTVGDVDMGGMTFAEAEEVLREHGARLRNTPICFERDEFHACALPSELGWYPHVLATTERAMRVGRDGGVVRAARERARAWTGGVKVRWAGSPRVPRVTRLIDEWEERLAALGHTVDRGQLRFKIRRAIATYPRRTLRIPVEETQTG